MPNSQDPTSPNYVPGVGRLVTDRFDFQKHVDGTAFRHNATQIDLFPTLVINSATVVTVQEALQALAGVLVVPTVNQATIGTSTSNLGIITLGGDFSGTSSTALSPKVGGIQGRPIQNIAPTVGQSLAWNGSFWTPTSVSPLGLAGGDLGGSYPNPTVIGIQGRSISSGVPTNGQVLEWISLNNRWEPTSLPSALPPNGAASGDLSGTYPNPTVAKLRTVSVSAVAPSSGQALIFNGSAWAPTNLGSSARAYFGNGSDGYAHFDGVTPVLGITPTAARAYYLTRNIICTDIIIDPLAIVVTNGFIIMCTGTLTVNGTIDNSGVDALNTNGGAGAPWSFMGGGSDGGNGLYFSTAQSGVSFATVGTNANMGLGGLGGLGGTPSNTGGSLNNSNPTAFDITRLTLSHWLSSNFINSSNATSTPVIVAFGGGSGGGGGAAPSGGPPIDGGGGGGGGGIILICANILAGSGIIQANGGAGANAPGGWAGGGGGGGGCVVIIYNTNPTWLGIAAAIGGNPGSGPNGTGQAGASGKVVYCQG